MFWNACCLGRFCECFCEGGFGVGGGLVVWGCLLVVVLLVWGVLGGLWVVVWWFWWRVWAGIWFWTDLYACDCCFVVWAMQVLLPCCWLWFLGFLHLFCGFIGLVLVVGGLWFIAIVVNLCGCSVYMARVFVLLLFGAGSYADL